MFSIVSVFVKKKIFKMNFHKSASKEKLLKNFMSGNHVSDMHLSLSDEEIVREHDWKYRCKCI